MSGTGSKYSLRKALGYGIGQFSDTIALQMFNMYVFTFYFAVVGIDVNLITIVFIIWSIWNAINDPMLGALSDRTKTKVGKRKPYILAAIYPLFLVMILIFTPPTGSMTLSFIYMLMMVVLFDITYTAFDLNYASLFPEMFLNLQDRAKANTIKQIFTVLGLIIASILPTLFIPKLDEPEYLFNYGFAALFMAIIIVSGIIILIFFGIKERVEFSKDYETAPSFSKSIKFSIKNKSFRTFIIANLAYWYVIGMLPTIVPLYGSFVLYIPEGESYLLGLLLGTTFISAAIFMPLWRFIAIKIGMKRGYMLSFITFITTLLPFMFITTVEIGFIAFFLVGIGLSGALLFADIVLAAIIDQDEITTGIRREGGYYGINALITKLSTILVI
ncbi:MAG: MFS transporter, partial [Candidatus Hermodarchaeota archaeon]